MATVNLHKTTDNLDDNAPAVVSHQMQRPAPRWDWPALLTVGALAIVAALLGWWLLPLYITLPFVVLFFLAAAKRFLLQDKIGGFAVWTFRNDIRGSQVVTEIGRAALAEAERPYPMVSSYSPTIQHAPAPKALPSGGETVDSPEVTVLEDVGPLAIPDWLRRLDAQPHIIFAAKTRGGKSTMAKFGMQPRIERGESFFVIDPHSNGWLDLPSVGGGLRWNEVGDAITHVTDLYRTRQDERRQYLDETGESLADDHFPRLNVILDEANETRMMLDKRVWEPFMQVMGSGARKCGISLWLIAQSALIKNLGGSSTMRRNFTVFALDHATITELLETEETNKARRDLINARIAGVEFPACMVDNGYAYLLDRTGIDRVHIQSARENAWSGFPRRPAARMAVAAKAQADTVARASVAVQPPTSGPVFRQERIELYLKKLVLDGKSRADIRAWCEANGLRFDNGKLTKVRSDLGLSEK